MFCGSYRSDRLVANLKQWYSSFELAWLSGLSALPNNVTRKARACHQLNLESFLGKTLSLMNSIDQSSPGSFASKASIAN